MTYLERKEERKKYYNKYVKGWKNIKCIACNGNGRYDNNGSPKCSSCEGTGKIKVSPEDCVEYKSWGL